MEERKVKIKTSKEFGVDLVKIWAMFSVISLHFYLHSGFYYFEKESSALFHTMARMLFYQCVPLFLMITGYLKRKTVFSAKHYIKLIPVITTYLLCSIIVVSYKVLYLKQSFKLIVWLQSLWAFKQPDYAWYVNLYVALFLIIPFVNAAYNSLKTRKEKTWAMLIVIFVTMFATSVNKIPLDNEYITNIGFVPDKFAGLWCLGYYVVGMYISEFKPKINKFLIVIMLSCYLYIEAFLNFITSTENFYTGLNFTNEDCVNVPVAALIFLLFYDIDIKNKVIRKIAGLVSSSSLTFLLLSWISDSFIYSKHREEFKGFSSLLPLYFKIIPLNFIITATASVVLTLMLKFINNFIMSPLFKVCEKSQAKPPESDNENNELIEDNENKESKEELPV